MKELIFLQAAEIDKNFSGLEKLWESFWPNALSFLVKIVFSLIIYVIGKKVIKILLKIVRKAFTRAKIEIGVENFILSLVKALLYLVLLITIAGILGIPEASFVAILGSAGLTLGLALQGSLSNFAGGVLILLLKPFRVGDYIMACGCEGTVTAVDIFYTKILTMDNKLVVLPNGTLSNENITNVTNEPNRRLDIIIPIGYEDDIRSVKESLRKIVLNNDMVLQDNAVDVFVNGFGNDAMELLLRVWVAKENYLVLKSNLLESIKYMFDERGYTIPYRQLDITIKNEITK